MSTMDTRLVKQGRLGLFDENSSIGHVDIAEKISERLTGKHLAQKNSGKFYTPPDIALPLIHQVLKVSNLNNKKGNVSIIDPFCGDGRLLAWLLPKITNKNLTVDVHLWDYDKEAVDYANSELLKLSKTCAAKINIHSKKTDSFSEFFNDNEERYDIVITNPPWEVVKPDTGELNKILDEKTKKEYINSLKQFSNRLVNDFPLSRPSKTYGGWGVNLARVGTELAVRLTKRSGIAALVTPSTIFADQSSYGVRKWMFEGNSLSFLNIFPAELKLFKDVDQPSVSFILHRDVLQKEIEISTFPEKKTTVINNLKEILEKTDYILPISVVTNATHLDLLTSLYSLPQFGDLVEKGEMWIGRELDETNHKTWLSLRGQYRFIKGRNVDRFVLNNETNFFINQAELKTKIPSSINYHRVVWRDVSRPTQKRRVIATIIPPGYITGNSLGVLHLRNSSNQEKLMAILGLVSSFVFEFQLRAHLATAHVSAGVIKKIRVPNWDDKFEKEIAEFVSKRLEGNPLCEAKLEVFIAKAYGLNRDQFQEILSTFPKITPQEKFYLLDQKIWQ